ncbi:hypothetical protein OG702_06300 [Streptomyces sp. NBC_01198]|nr:hypothetical protein OG702_06300 [Streptomyces sp. NBC_01198]
MTVPVVDGSSVILTVAPAPESTVPGVQVTTRPETEQVPCEGTADRIVAALPVKVVVEVVPVAFRSPALMVVAVRV